jgi:hypothetical protein
MGGTSIGILFGAQAAGSSIAPLIGGIIADRWGLPATFWFLAAHDRHRQPLHPRDAPGRAQIASLGKWLGSTSNRTFVAGRSCSSRSRPCCSSDCRRSIRGRLPLLAWGYLQYRLVGTSARVKAAVARAFHSPDRIVERAPIAG